MSILEIESRNKFTEKRRQWLLQNHDCMQYAISLLSINIFKNTIIRLGLSWHFLERFEMVEPTLHQIFVDRVGADAAEGELA